ncbi:MAG TPA: cytochrome c [Rhodocyclaceae bacterium]
MTPKLAALLCAPLLLAACGGEAPDNRPGQPVAHRRAAFKNLLKDFEPIGVMMREDRYDATQFKLHADAVLAERDVPWQYFKPDTLYPPSKAKPDVWSDAAGFEAARKKFMDATDQLAAAAKAPDEKKARAAFEAVQGACQDCHKVYKQR